MNLPVTEKNLTQHTAENDLYPKVRGEGICRFCQSPLTTSFVDLGMSPLCESFLTAQLLDQMEPYYPLHALICGKCFLVQLSEFVKPEHIFTEYAYFSSYSTSWVEHARRYCEMVKARFGLDSSSRVFEIASNDGYLLQHFLPLGVPVIGIEPAANVAAVARQKNIPTLVEFFGLNLARRLVSEGHRADLIIGNNVLAQVPDLNDFTAGMAYLLAPNGIITLEFPHLERLINENQFDTIYHEHFSYFSLVTIERLAKKHGLKVFDVEQLPTHGGSLRVYLCDLDAGHAISPRVNALLVHEREIGFEDIRTYARVCRKGSSHEERTSFVPDRLQRGRRQIVRLRCSRQRKYTAKLLRDRDRFLRFHRRPQPVQARPLHTRNAYSDLSGVCYRRGTARLFADNALEFEERDYCSDAPR